MTSISSQEECVYNTFFTGKTKKPHPFHVKYSWNPPVQRSVALESYLGEVKTQLAEIQIVKPLNPAEREALKTFQRDTEINLKNADK